MKKSIVVVVGCLLLASSLFAQLSTSRVSGVVQDSAGAAMPGAHITITNTGTDVTSTAVSGEKGDYTVLNLPAGAYQLKVTRDGFNTYVQSGIVLELNVNPEINVTLAVGSQATEVTVESNAAMVETQTVGVGQVIDGERLVDLPLNGRDASQMVVLSGAAVATGSGGNRAYPTGSSFSIAGGQSTETNYVMDGGAYMNTDSNLGLPLPFPDALEEFKVETSALGSSYGDHPGGVVNVATKSGTNEFHGDVFEFVRNGVFNARNTFALTRDTLKRNQYGGVIGGPIRRNHLFFFAGYQGTSNRTDPTTTISFVETPAVLAGNFQQLLSPACAGKQVNAGAPYVNDQIAPSLFNPVSLKVLALIPVSNDPCGKVQYGIPTPSNEEQGIVRIDWHKSAHDLFARYYVTNYFQAPYYDGSLLTANTVGLGDRVMSGMAGDTYTVSPTAVNTFRATFSRSSALRLNPSGIPTMCELGSNASCPVPNFTGQFSVSGYISVGGLPGYFVNNTLQLSDSFNLIRGGHQITFGFSWFHTQLNGLGPFQENPRYTFSGQITGNAMTDFMIGDVSTFLQGNGQIAYDRLNSPNAFIQDNWKVSRTLNVSLGVRWTPFFPQHQIENLVESFSLPGFLQNVHSGVFTNAPAGLSFVGDPGFPGHSDTSQTVPIFDPRAGIVYDPRGKGKEVIRAGYGIFGQTPYTWMTQQIPLDPPYGETITLTAPSGGFSNPWASFPGGNPFPTPVPLPKNFGFPLPGTYVFEPVHVKPTYTQEWNAAFQKQFGSNWSLTLTYMGSKTTHLWVSREIDPAVYVAGNCAAGQYGLTAPGACSTLANENQRRVLMLANPSQGQYYGSVSMLDDGGNANYEGFLSSIQHRLARNFTALVNNTWSKCIDDADQSNGGNIANNFQNPGNRKGDRAICGNNRADIFNASLVAKTPNFTSPWVRRIAGGWQASAIFSASSGAPLTVTVGTDNALTGVGRDRPNVVGTTAVSDPTTAAWFNTAAFAKAALGSYGDAGRDILVGPGMASANVALSRSFAVAEKRRIEIRAEAFNVLNRANYGNPNTAMNNSLFGKITTAGDPRIMQFAMKFVF